MDKTSRAFVNACVQTVTARSVAVVRSGSGSGVQIYSAQSRRLRETLKTPLTDIDDLCSAHKSVTVIGPGRSGRILVADSPRLCPSSQKAVVRVCCWDWASHLGGNAGIFMAACGGSPLGTLQATHYRENHNGTGQQEGCGATGQLGSCGARDFGALWVGVPRLLVVLPDSWGERAGGRCPCPTEAYRKIWVQTKLCCFHGDWEAKVDGPKTKEERGGRLGLGRGSTLETGLCGLGLG